MTKEARFTSEINQHSPLLHVHYFTVTGEVAHEIITDDSRRFVCTINDSLTWQCGLVSLGQGDYYVTISKARMKTAGLKNGDTVQVHLITDVSEYGMEMPEELSELLVQDEEGNRRFHALSKGFQRYIIHYVGMAKSPVKRLERALLLIGNLKLLPQGKETFRQMLGKEPR